MSRREATVRNSKGNHRYIDKAAEQREEADKTAALQPPKRPVNPYLHFAKIQRKLAKEVSYSKLSAVVSAPHRVHPQENPTMSVRDTVSSVASMWRGLTEAQKQPYMDMAEQV